MDLRNLIEVHLDLDHLSKDLDELGGPGRLWAVRQWTRGDARILWNAAAGRRTLTPDELVPLGAPGDVVYEGFRPGVPGAGHFKAHFRRTALENPGPGDPPRVLTYEEHPIPVLAGPRHALVVPRPGAGELALDHGAVGTAVPADWPPVRSSSGLFGPPAWTGLDVLRGLSTYVILARAGRRTRTAPTPKERPPTSAADPRHGAPLDRMRPGEVDQWLDMWTVLVRQEMRARS